ncbi:unnamed protein product [Onchocerca flexuosa]|uniref:Uncharacterized protein n=1 Tax=Onchocerca flexuosa TaxID=387005 RepID=A0A183GYJ3_9BILA|nr:unnamed protein product [Onchocerca flexuosa]
MNLVFNEQRKNEFAIFEVANVAMSTSFVTPPSKSPVPPMAPRKKKTDKKSLKTANSPSYFPKTIDSPSFFPKKSLTMRHVLPKEHRLFHPPTASILSMVLRSAAKPRRSTRIKKNEKSENNEQENFLENQKKQKSWDFIMKIKTQKKKSQRDSNYSGENVKKKANYIVSIQKEISYCSVRVKQSNITSKESVVRGIYRLSDPNKKVANSCNTTRIVVTSRLCEAVSQSWILIKYETF